MRQPALYLTTAFLIICVSFDGHAESAPTPSPASSTTYYVDSQSGNDANSGISPAVAWKSLERVNTTIFHPGQRILLKSGSVWQGQLWPKGSGTEGHPITVSMYDGGIKPIINGAGIAEDAVLLKNQEYWEIENLEVTNTGPGRATRRGVHLVLENFGDAHHVYIRSLTIHDVNGTDNVKPNGGISYTCTGELSPAALSAFESKTMTLTTWTEVAFLAGQTDGSVRSGIRASASWCAAIA